MNRATQLKDLPFPEAVEKWLEERSLHIRKTTIDCYRDYLKPVTAFLANVDPPAATLGDVHLGVILEYQKRHKDRYHPASVNHHLNTLSQMMRRAGLWQPIAEFYEPLPVPEKDAPKVMSEAVEDAFFQFASKNDDWSLAYLVASATNNTTASGKELRMMQLQHIELQAVPPTITVPKNMKTQHRPRTIPLNDRGAEMMRRLIRRANSLGSTRPDHYLFPFRKRRNFFEPTKPASESWLKYRWKMLVEAAMLHNDPACPHIGKLEKDQYCPICPKGVLPFKITPHMLRHQIITSLIDSGVPLEIVRKIAGHGVDSVITATKYHHGRLEVMARAMDRIDPGRKKPKPDSAASDNGKGELA